MAIFGPKYPCLQEGIVNLKNGTSFQGVIWARKGRYLVLRNAVLLKARGESTPVDGEVLVAEQDVEFIQLPKAGR